MIVLPNRKLDHSPANRIVKVSDGGTKGLAHAPPTAIERHAPLLLRWSLSQRSRNSHQDSRTGSLNLVFLWKMYPGGYTAEVTGLSPKATEEDVYKFFGHCGAVDHVEIIRSGEYASTAYVTFRDAFALQTAILLSGARIVDQCVCITSWGSYIDESDAWNSSTYPEGNTSSTTYHSSQFVSTPGEAVTVVKTLASKGYVLGKDALAKAKAFDESHQLSATAAAKVCELSDRMGLTEKIYAGREVVKTVDEKFHVSDITKSAATVTGTAVVVAATYTGEAAVAAGSAVVNSSYFAKGALWFSDVLTRASKAAADLGSHGGK